MIILIKITNTQTITIKMSEFIFGILINYFNTFLKTIKSFYELNKTNFWYANPFTRGIHYS